MTVIVQDSFNRSDNTTLGVSETGQTWKYYSGTFGISGNQALAKTAAIHNNCFVDVGVQGDYRVSAKFNNIFDSNLIGLIFKRNSTASDNSFYALRKNSSNLQIVRNNNGFSTLSSVATTFADGDVLSVECVGSEIKFYQNGVLKGTVTDNTLTTNTGYGIYSSNNTVALFDNFIVEDFNTGGGDTEPIATIVSISKNVISDEPEADRAIVTFTFDQDITQWEVRVLGAGNGTGTLADSGGSVSNGTEITAEIDFTELYQEGENKVNIYGRNSEGLWTPYE